MKKQKFLLFCLALVLASATLLGATLFSGLFLEWVRSFSEREGKIFEFTSLFITAIFIGVGFYRRRRRRESKE